MARTKTAGYTPVGPNRRGVILVSSGVVALGVLCGTFAAGRASVTTTVSTVAAAPHMTVQDGIPIAASRTRAGAAAAAENYQIAGFRVSAGTLDSAAAMRVMVAPSASPAATSTLAVSTTPRGQLARTRSSFAPVSAVVQTFTPSQATVLVWGVSAQTSQITPQPGGTEDWGRTTVSLAWDSDRWRITDQHYDAGPWPARSDQRMASSTGDFSFRYQESPQSWCYVPLP